MSEQPVTSFPLSRHVIRKAYQALDVTLGDDLVARVAGEAQLAEVRRLGLVRSPALLKVAACEAINSGIYHTLLSGSMAFSKAFGRAKVDFITLKAERL